MSETVTGKQPWYVPFTLWAGPGVWALILAYLNFNSYRLHGRVLFHAEDLILHGFGVMLLAIPLFMPYRKVTAVPDRIVARHYLGKRIDLPWGEIRKVEIVSRGISGAQTRILRLIPVKGRKISFTSQITNFEALVETVVNRTVAPIVRKRAG